MGSALICSLSNYKILVFSDQLDIYLEALWHGWKPCTYSLLMLVSVGH